MSDYNTAKIQWNNEDLISVIVPIYNASDYLEECIQSIRKQTCPNIEIFLINDGSTDRSGDICNQHAKEDGRITVVHQRNQGVSAARNLGLELMHGGYVTFIDADDVVHEQYLEALYYLCKAKQCKISCCGYEVFLQKDSLKWKRIFPEQLSGEILDRKEALSRLNELQGKPAAEMAIVWNKMYKKEIWNTVRFPLHIRHEDEFVIHHALAGAGRIVMTNEMLYGYRRHAASYMGAGDQKNNFSHMALHHALADRIEFYEKEEPDLVYGAMHHLLRESNAFYGAYGEKDAQHRNARRQLVRQYRKVYKKYFTRIPGREKVLGGIFACLPGVYHELSRLKRKG